MNSASTSNYPQPDFEERQPSSLEDALGVTTILLIGSIQAIIPNHAEYQRLALQASRLIPLYGYEGFRIVFCPTITCHLEKLKDLGYDVLHAVDQITNLVQIRRAQSSFLRILTRRAYLGFLNGHKEQLDIAVEAFKVQSIYEARHPVLELVIGRLGSLITDIQNVVMKHLERQPSFRRAPIGSTRLRAPIVPAVEPLNDQSPPGATFLPGISNPYYPYITYPYTPASTQPSPPLNTFGPPPPVMHLTISMIGSGNTTTSTLRNVSNDNSEVYSRHN